jgi:carbamoyltransferase
MLTSVKRTFFLIILGLNAFHADSSAAILRDGVLIAAAEEERFRRTKHWAGFPSEAISYCLREAGIRLSDVEHIAVNQDSRANLWRKLWYVGSRRPDPGFLLVKLKNRRKRAGIVDYLAQEYPEEGFNGKLHAIEHHLSHLYSAFNVSPFDQANVVSIDGFGDFSSTAWGTGRGDTLSVDGRVYFPHSLGMFYEAITQYLGFPNYGDEYKVMGLAPYGTAAHVNAMREIVRLLPGGAFELNLAYFNHHKDPISQQFDGGAPQRTDVFSKALEELLGPRRKPSEPLEKRHHDIAHSMQMMYEEAFFHLLTTIQQQSGLTDLALAGGCAMNSVANGKIRRRTSFRRVYVQSAAGDAGGAIGAALAAHHKLGGKRSFVMDHAYWGPQFSDEQIADLLTERQTSIEEGGCAVKFNLSQSDLCRQTATAIADGKVIGWFQGRMEWGPRALGNRSILCDPRRADMKAILNTKIKRRESFRPFAPSILEEVVGDWFEEDDAVPFMMQVFQIREQKRQLIPAVTHVDGSGRLQSVSRKANARYYELIEAFRDLTDVPMVLNTSFNENEPVVCKPAEALDCFLRTKMDILVLGNTILTRN